MKDRILHCIAKRERGYWSARCLDFTLYAVGDSQAEATAKLAAQIEAYLYDAMDGEDKDHGPALLLRRAPWRDWAEYHALAWLARFPPLRRAAWATLFDAHLPTGPYRHA